MGILPSPAAAGFPEGAAPAADGRRARILEHDPLLRLHAVRAAASIGFLTEEPRGATALPDGPVTLFVGLDRADSCPRCGGAPRGPAPPAPASPAGAPLTVGYVSGPPVLLAAHARHGCADMLLQLVAVDGHAAFVYPGPASPGGTDDGLPPDITAREADVLVLLLDGCTTAETADRLRVSPATVRTHCRALLRKCGAASRRALRARLFGAAVPVRAFSSETSGDAQDAVVVSQRMPEERNQAASTKRKHAAAMIIAR